MLAEQRLLVENCFNGTRLKIRRSRRGERGDHADQLLIAKRHDHPRPALGLLPSRHRIGERAVQRHGQRDFAVRQAWEANLKCNETGAP